MTAVETSAEYVLLTPSARKLSRGSDYAAGLDICADFFDKTGAPRRLFDGQDHHDLQSQASKNEAVFRLAPGKRILIPTGISITTTPDIYTQIAPRSGLALKNGLQILGGVVDCDYTGEVGVIAQNSNPVEFIEITHGMRIAQLLLKHVWLGMPRQVKSLPERARGASGFGSTGT